MVNEDDDDDVIFNCTIMLQKIFLFGALIFANERQVDIVKVSMLLANICVD